MFMDYMNDDMDEKLLRLYSKKLLAPVSLDTKEGI
jgi:hypothetical protein